MSNPQMNTSQGGGQALAAPPQPQRMTPEELKVLKECNSESFWYRCVPLGVLFIGGTQLLTTRGILTPHPKYGALMKNIGAGLAAFMLGKISYQDACRQKILRLENSPLAEAMRNATNPNRVYDNTLKSEYKMRGSGSQPAQVPYSASAPAYDMQTPVKTRQQTDDDYQGEMTDNDSNIEARGLDDSNRPSIDSTQISLAQQDANVAAQRRNTSYDELRERNRADYERRTSIMQNPPPRQQNKLPSQEQMPPSKITENVPSYDLGGQQSGMRLSQPPSSAAQNDWENQPIRRSRGVRRNEYGDIIEE